MLFVSDANQADVQCCCAFTELRQENAWLELDAPHVFGLQGDRKMNICVFSLHVRKQHPFSVELFDISKTGGIFWVLIFQDENHLSLNYLFYLLRQIHSREFISLNQVIK